MSALLGWGGTPGREYRELPSGGPKNITWLEKMRSRDGNFDNEEPLVTPSRRGEPDLLDKSQTIRILRNNRTARIVPAPNEPAFAAVKASVMKQTTDNMNANGHTGLHLAPAAPPPPPAAPPAPKKKAPRRKGNPTVLTEATEEAPPRRRGRPPKSDEARSRSPSAERAVEPSDKPVKRGPGRPRKVVTDKTTQP